MASFEVDTEKIRESGQDIINIVRSLNEQFNELFYKISMITQRNIWVGNSANEFVRIAKFDKAQYTVFNNEIYKLGKLLTDYSYYLERDIESFRG